MSPPITPTVQCKHFSISCSASSASPEYLPQHPELCACVYVDIISQQTPTMQQNMRALNKQNKKERPMDEYQVKVSKT